jgi:threonine dehydrogenase-like Zn-dependent dehydrogenase
MTRKTMKALHFDGQLHFSRYESRPVPPKGEALIRVLLAGICNTDLEIIRGYMGFTGIPGHEFVGIVEEVHAEDQHLLGKRVVGEINCACGRNDCYYCRHDLGRHCPDRTTLGIFRRDGCLAEYTTLPVENLLEVPEYIPDSMAALTEPLAAAFEILEQIDLSQGDDVLIVGDGKLGLLINHALSTTGARITHVGKHAGKLAIARTTGAETVLLNHMPDKQYDVVVEATGNANGIGFSVAHTKPRGTLILKSTLAAHQPLDLNPVVVNELTIIGSRCGLFQPALRYLQSGVDLSSLIEAIYPADQILEAFDKAKTKGAMKVLVDFRTKS